MDEGLDCEGSALEDKICFIRPIPPVEELTD